MSPSGPLTIEQGRAMQARARHYMLFERAGVVMSGVAIPLFVVSYLELRGIDESVIAGGSSRVPYFAWGAIALFAAGFCVMKLARHGIATISRALSAEQERRVAEGDEPFGSVGLPGSDGASAPADGDTPAGARSAGASAVGASETGPA